MPLCALCRELSSLQISALLPWTVQSHLQLCSVLGHSSAAPGAEHQDIYLFKKVSCLGAYFANLSSVFT